MFMMEVGIYFIVFCDLFIVMGELLDDGVWVICVYIKFFVIWIWVGVVFMVLGGVCLISDRCYCMVKLVKVKKVVIFGNVVVGESV